MIKFVIAAVWLCAATLGAVFFAFQTAGAKPDDGKPHEASMMGGLDYVKTEIISVPLIREGVVAGYFLSRLVYTVDPVEMKKLTVPADALLSDVVYSYVYGSPELDFAKHKTLDLDAFRKGVKDSINASVKFDLVKDVLVQQVDYLSKTDIRDNLIKRRSAVPKAEKPKGKHGGAEAEAAPEGHGEEPRAEEHAAESEPATHGEPKEEGGH